MEGATSTEDISSLWSGVNGPPDNDWAFWQILAATCLADTTITTILKDSTIPLLTSCDAGGLSVIERMSVEHDCT
jgi:hypothetical protein